MFSDCNSKILHVGCLELKCDAMLNDAFPDQMVLFWLKPGVILFSFTSSHQLQGMLAVQ